jgi:hypothetical protein
MMVVVDVIVGIGDTIIEWYVEGGGMEWLLDG